jgi:hypothetical protein
MKIALNTLTIFALMAAPAFADSYHTSNADELANRNFESALLDVDMDATLRALQPGIISEPFTNTLDWRIGDLLSDGMAAHFSAIEDSFADSAEPAPAAEANAQTRERRTRQATVVIEAPNGQVQLIETYKVK